uniref:DUF4939 domain-containing protein n=1 Tax=Takifugu rubripes TaxID=31033 RepID=A0A674MMR7_TAKRU
MDPADQDAVRRTLEAQGRLLGQHDQLLTDIWTSLQTLNASVTNLLSSGRSEQGPPPPPVKAPRVAPQLVAAAPWKPHVPIPERYSGEAGYCASFLLQCSLVFDLQPLTYPSDRAKIAFVVNLLSGRAAVLENQSPVSSSFLAFMAELKRVFDHPVQSSEAAFQILSLRHGASSVADYSIHFRILAARSGWNDVALWGVFMQGLSDDLKDELATRDEPGNLKVLIGLATRLDNRLRERCQQRTSERAVRNSGDVSSEPMQLGRTHLTLSNTGARQVCAFTVATQAIFSLTAQCGQKIKLVNTGRSVGEQIIILFTSGPPNSIRHAPLGSGVCFCGLPGGLGC